MYRVDNPPYYLSAYSIALKNGFEGTEEEWLVSLRPQVTGNSVTYQVGENGEDFPTGSWSSEIPNVPKGKFLWTKVCIQFDVGEPVFFYSVARMGMDGSGSVSSVNHVSPDPAGNVTLTAEKVGARPSTWTPTAEQVGARPSTWTPTAADVGAVPTSRTVNGKALSEDIKLTASDVGALPQSGGTLTGPLILTEGVHYGDTLPEPGTPGRIFFKKVSS